VEKIEQPDQSEGKSQTGRADQFITSWIYDNSVPDHRNSSGSSKFAKEICVFHQCDVRKPANLFENFASAEEAVVAIAHSKEKPGVMREAITESINKILPRKSHSKKSTYCLSISQRALNISKSAIWNSRVGMQEPKNVALGGTRAGIQLTGASRGRLQQLVAEAGRKFRRAIGARSIDDDDFGFRRALAQVDQRFADEGCFVQDWHDDRDVHLIRAKT
jgi:hypothetical protein